MFGIVNADPNLRQASSSWMGKATVYSLSSGVAGAATGALLGTLGSWLPESGRIAVASLLGIAAAILGGGELYYGRLRPMQCDRETPQRWLGAGALRWAARNGAALGIGATTRIGFWLWYAIPLAALLYGRPALGAVIYGLYGLVRGGAVWALILGMVLRPSTTPLAFRLLLHIAVARAAAAAVLLALGLAVAIVVGL